MNHHFTWRARRGGGVTEITLSDRPRVEAEATARACGWPGHDGGRWNYLHDDLKRIWQWRASWPDGVVTVRLQRDDKLVHEAMNNAVENGYHEMMLSDPELVAIDLGTCDAALEGREPAELIPHIETWQAAHRAAA
jgi:hypothetical protein